MVLIRKHSAVVIKHIQEMHCRRCFVGQMWVVSVILLLTTIVFTAVNAEHIELNGDHDVHNGSQVSAHFVYFKILQSIFI